MEQSTAIKLIIKRCFKEEEGKKRDHTDNGSPVFGDKSNAISACLVDVEIEIEKKVKRLLDGESINSIVPDLIDEDEYDKID